MVKFNKIERRAGIIAQERGFHTKWFESSPRRGDVISLDMERFKLRGAEMNASGDYTRDAELEEPNQRSERRTDIQIKLCSTCQSA